MSTYYRIRVSYDYSEHFVSEETYGEERALRIASAIAAACSDKMTVEVIEQVERASYDGELPRTGEAEVKR